ncbi:Uncharacterised protein [Mycobacteroides abscessus subsp. massiliense]|nr:hypothetical protein [Mycobacteroides abscessus]RIR61006.1 hypothetical protein D2E33_08285 [Mycobacteroides abscessus]RIT66070.1 hypothetical protein D2E87_19435 [Mycobacteroides abscessus]SIE58667.1 Uncharacterised protein [Mycobacteroides abscessus subsp. abscessus]SKM80240.1 Uncharacterised protein [Mycobacteroides abscessus subsp. massiliense]SKM99668.1 Uncharacterised protein [Mycobacteroides abscessus subsp. massiliense]
MEVQGHAGPKTIKVVAKRLYDTTPGRLYFAESDDDYEEMRKFPGGTFGCPECGLPFRKPSRPPGKRYHFAFKPNTSCDHLPARPSHGGGGGPMSEEHKWLQNRLLVVCRHAGHEAIPEHRATDSDIYVPSADYAIEVQRWPTDWKKRTKARMDKGAKVLWMIPDSMGNEKNRSDALFSLPCVRVRVHARGDENHPLQPWNNKADNHNAVLSVFATVARYDSTNEKLVSARYFDAIKFFRQILDGRRAWYPKNILEPLGLDYAAWVLDSDFNAAKLAAQKHHEAEQERRRAELAAAQARREAEEEICRAEHQRLERLLREAEERRRSPDESTPTAIQRSQEEHQRPSTVPKDQPNQRQPVKATPATHRATEYRPMQRPISRTPLQAPQQQLRTGGNQKLIVLIAACVVGTVVFMVLVAMCSADPPDTQQTPSTDRSSLWHRHHE